MYTIHVRVLTPLFHCPHYTGDTTLSNCMVNVSRILYKMIKVPAAERNKEPIFQVLKQIVSTSTAQQADAKKYILEIASGYGTHSGYFAPKLPSLTFQPTDVQQETFSSMRKYGEGIQNVLPPVQVDVSRGHKQWTQLKLSVGSVDGMICVNMIHISSNAAVDGLFINAGALLKPQTGFLLTYGPYSVHGVLAPESNINFDRSLKCQNPEWGIRDTDFLDKLATENGLRMESIHHMPANNKILIFRKI